MVSNKKKPALAGAGNNINERLEEETERLQSYLNDHFEGNILTLSEYIEKFSDDDIPDKNKIKPPKSFNREDLTSWKTKYNIAYLIELQMFKNRVDIFIYKTKAKKDYRSQIGSYMYDSSGKNEEQMEQQIKKAYAQVTPGFFIK